MMRLQLLTLVLAGMLLTTNLYALKLQEKDQNVPDKTPPPVDEVVEQDRPRPRPLDRKRFKPSEKISADSAVSFPVDI